MRNILKKISVFMMTAILAFSVYAAPANAKISKKAQHKLYATTMKCYAKAVKKAAKRNGSYAGDRKVMYVFADIDKDGIDECIMRYSNPSYDNNTATSSGYGETTSIYTIKKGKVKTVFNKTNFDPACHDTFVRIFKGSSYIDQGFSHGYDDHSFYKYKNGKLSKKPAYIMQSYENIYEINGKRVKKSIYKNKYKKLTRKQKGYIMKLY